MSVGLLAGSMPGAIFGFGTGLLVDTVLVQTLGITSLLYIPIGYWSGRLRELRDPAHGLVPLAAGAAATAFAGIGMALIQFLLGVDAPVSLLLLQQIFITVLVNTLIALPGLRARAPVVLTGAARRPAPPPAPRLHDRRPQPAAAALAAARSDHRGARDDPAPRRSPAADDAAARAARRDHRQLRAGACSRSSSSGCGSCRCCPATSTSSAATVNRVRDVAIAAPRGEILDAAASVLVELDAGARRSRSSDDCPAVTWQLSTAAADRRVVFRRLAHVLRMSTKQRHGARLRRPATRRRAVPSRADPVLRSRSSWRSQCRTPTSTSSRSHHDIQYYLAENAAAVPRRPGVQQVYVPSYPQGDARPRSCSGTVGRITPAEARKPATVQLQGASRRGPQRDHRPVGPGGRVRPLPARHRRHRSGSRSTRSASRGLPARRRRRSPATTSKLSLDTQLQRVGQQALAESIASNPGADGGSFVAMNPSNGAIYAMGSLADVQPVDLHQAGLGR